MAQVVCPVLVGRDAEMSGLAQALAGVGAGRGGLLSISGPAGIGKSRLLRELMDRAITRGLRVVTGRATPAAVISPYTPILEALLQLLRGITVPADDAMVTWLPHLAGLVPDVTPSNPAGEQHVAGGLTSVALRGEAVIQLLRRVAGSGLVIMLEDLHWADPDTVALVEFLADNLVDEPVLVAVTIRSESPCPALEMDRRQRTRRGAIRIVLGALDAAGVEEMIRKCGVTTSPEKRNWVRDVADGVPLLVEDLLASPGLPESISASVRERLEALGPGERTVIETAAVLGRHFDWELIARVTGRSLDSVADALAQAVTAQLVVADGDGFRFRHAITREGVLATLLPPHHRLIAASALLAVETGDLSGARRDLAADLAVQAGASGRAAQWLIDSGRQSLELGALQTAIDTLRRALALVDDDDARVNAGVLLLDALAAAGRVDDVTELARVLPLSLDPQRWYAALPDLELRVAAAAVAATRWPMAKEHLRKAEALAADQTPQLRAHLAVLRAEVAFADDDPGEARRQAETALALGDIDPALRCHGLELIGRAERLRDLDAARDAFSSAFELADRHRLPLARMQALHELGTLDMFDRVDTERLGEARRSAQELGALSTIAVLDLQLAACFTSRWDLEACDRHAHSALSLAEQLGLDQVRAKALAMLTGSASMRADLDETTRLASRSVAAAPTDRMLEGFALASIGLCHVLRDDVSGALDVYARGMALLAGLPNAEPAANRALWPLILAARGDRRAHSAIEEARRLGVGSFGLNRGLLHYAEAVLAGSNDNPQQAERLAASALPSFANCEVWAVLARFLAANPARTHGWGTPELWLAEAAGVFARRGLGNLAQSATRLRRAATNPWVAAAVTNREADVLRLIREGLSNKAIAGRLGISPRTVEKHVENLLRKTGRASRVELAVYATSTT